MSSFTLLLVEDSYGDQKLVAEALKSGKRDTNLQIAGNGDEAISYLSRNGNDNAVTAPNLIILDLNLPGKGGYEILAEIKQHTALAHIPIVILTGAKVPLDGPYAPDFYLVKPDSLAKYFRVVLAVDEFGRNMLVSPGAREAHLEKLRRSVE